MYVFAFASNKGAIKGRAHYKELESIEITFCIVQRA